MPSLAPLLTKRLDPNLAALIGHAGQVAAEAGIEIYLVGGSVRDLVLGGVPRDPDIVVVGGAQQYATQLARKIGGEVGAPSEFGTVAIRSETVTVDVATARSETYEHPGALPTVIPSNIEKDLRRRDFSVNAMAVSILPKDRGRLVDPSKGFSDCARRRLRILHETSFADDPTRAIRAVRYMARLGFQLEAATAAAMERDLHFMDLVSGQRVRAELEKLLAEPKRVDAIRIADRLGVLAAVEPGLRPSSAGLTALEDAEDGMSSAEYFAYLVAGLTAIESDAVIRRLNPPKEWREIIAAGHRYRGISSVLDREDLAPSEVVELLGDFPTEALAVQARLAPPTAQRKHIRDYLQRFCSVRPELTGDDLIEIGATEGPAVGKILAELRAAKLDGKVHSRDDELALARRRLSPR